MPAPIDFYFEFASPYGYLASEQIDALGARHGRAVMWHAIVLDAQTGEVLALANYPTYNPNDRSRLSGEQLRNRVLTDTFEPGSTVKPFVAAWALETGRVKPDTLMPPFGTTQGTLLADRAQFISDREYPATAPAQGLHAAYSLAALITQTR